MSRINIKAVAIGSVVNVGGGLIFGLVYSIAYGVILAFQGVPQAEMKNRILADESSFVIDLIVGLALLAAGSYLAARLARGREMMHAAIVGLVSIGVGVLFSLGPDTARWPAWFLPITFGFTLPISVLGGFVARRRAPTSSLH